MDRRRWIRCAPVLAAAVLRAGTAGAALPAHDTVEGLAGGDPIRVAKVDVVELASAADGASGVSTAWDDLSKIRRKPGLYRLSFAPPDAATAVEIPVCAGRGRIAVNGAAVANGSASPAPVVAVLSRGGAHDVVTIDVTVGNYEQRIACGDAPRAGRAGKSRTGLGLLTFTSPYAARGGGKALVYLPAAREKAGDAGAAMPALVGVHPWDGSMWTYAAYGELFREADARGVVLVMPSGLGNSLYTADAENEVLLALDAASREVPIDPARVSIWGASMGGAGATTIGFHKPDRFAAVTSFFGDSKYDLGTYVKAILRDAAGAHAVNALDIVDNARNLDVWLVHGEDDRVSPIVQSAQLAKALETKGFKVRFDRAPGMGHEGALVTKYAREVVARAAVAKAPARPPRVSYWSVRPGDTAAYGVTIARGTSSGDAFIDIEATPAGGVRVHAAKNVKEIVLGKNALGVPCTLSTALQSLMADGNANGAGGVSLRCEAP